MSMRLEAEAAAKAAEAAVGSPIRRGQGAPVSAVSLSPLGAGSSEAASDEMLRLIMRTPAKAALVGRAL